MKAACQALQSTSNPKLLYFQCADMNFMEIDNTD